LGRPRLSSKVDPKYRRAQMSTLAGWDRSAQRSQDHSSGHFTLSTMVLPPGNEGPLHLHSDVEELFFVLEVN
jgi:mannose-6-phosphate isomerase-like protein (cupin superfamily)